MSKEHILQFLCNFAEYQYHLSVLIIPPGPRWLHNAASPSPPQQSTRSGYLHFQRVLFRPQEAAMVADQSGPRCWNRGRRSGTKPGSILRHRQ